VSLAEPAPVRRLGQQQAGVHAQYIVRTMAEHPRRRIVPEGDAPLGIQAKNGVGRGLRDLAKARHAGLAGGLQPAQLQPFHGQRSQVVQDLAIVWREYRPGPAVDDAQCAQDMAVDVGERGAGVKAHVRLQIPERDGAGGRGSPHVRDHLDRFRGEHGAAQRCVAGDLGHGRAGPRLEVQPVPAHQVQQSKRDIEYARRQSHQPVVVFFGRRIQHLV